MSGHPLTGANRETFQKIFREYCGLEHCEKTNHPFSKQGRIRYRAANLANFALQLTVARERRRHQAGWERTAILKGPVFVTGHWRSGTTYLHELLSQHPEWSTLTTFQSFFPYEMLRTWSFSRLGMKMVMPKERGADSVELGLDTPQEEEFALANLGAISALFGIYFPSRVRDNFRRAVLMEGLSPEDLLALEKAYLHVVRSLTLCSGGQRVLLKNPVTATRVPFLKNLFPQGRFIFIIREPKDVFRSSCRMFKTLMDLLSFETYDPAQIPEAVRDSYQLYFQRWREIRAHLNPEEFFEVRFEDLVADPPGECRKMFDHFQWEGKAPALEQIARYAESKRDYQKTRHPADVPGLEAFLACPEVQWVRETYEYEDFTEDVKPA